MCGADVFCAPSLHGESFGVVLLEAMAAGAVVVASALDGYANVATDGVDSLLSPPGDSEALASALTRALTDGRLRRDLIAAAEARAQEFSMGHLAEAYIERYERLADAGRGARPA
jgi:phosphatidylinositol alpha-mannosyltransferase